MRFEDSETQKLLRTTTRSFLADRFPWEKLYALERTEGELGADDLTSFADMGWLGLLAPAEAGGAGLALVEAAAIIDEFGYAGVPSPVVVSNIVADALARLPGSPAREHLISLVQGTARYSLSDGVLELSNGSLRGALRFVPYGASSDYVLTPLIVEGESGIGLTRSSAGRATKLRTLDRRSYADLHFDGAPGEGLLVLATGTEAQAIRERCRTLAAGFAVVEMAGLLNRIKEMTGEYISNRVQFGQPIGKFQAARHHGADLLAAAETTRWAAYHALWQLDRDPGDSEGIWLARHWSIRAARQAIEITHLLHGGVGVGMEYPLHILTQTLASLAAQAGTLDEMTERALASMGLEQAAATD